VILSRTTGASTCPRALLFFLAVWLHRAPYYGLSAR